MEIASAAPLLSPRATAAAETEMASGTMQSGADFKSFLTLLTTQMRFQDPMQPLDSTQFVAQLASFSTVEQLIGVNDRLKALEGRSDAALLASYGSWVGREASAVDGSFAASGGPEPFQIDSIPGTERIEAVVRRIGTGTEVDRFTVAADAQGNAVWAGAGAAGVTAGTRLQIELVYHGTEAVIDRRPAAVFRQITGLGGTSAGPVFQLEGGGTLAPDQLAELRQGG